MNRTMVVAFHAGVAAFAVMVWKSVRRHRVRGLLQAEFRELRQQAPGICYDTVAREWRCKVASRDALGEAQQAWQPFAAEVARIPGVVRVQRLCCGTCLDFRILVSVREDAYSDWKEMNHHPEEEVLGALRARVGCFDVQSQLLSIMDCSQL